MTAGESGAPTEDHTRLQENPYVSEVPEDFQRPEEVPVWEAEPYLDAIALRLMHHYDLEQNKTVGSRSFPMYGRLLVENERHVLHPALSFGYHQSTEHLFVTVESTVDEQTLNQAEQFGEQLAKEWVCPDTEHYSTDFTFVFVTATIPDHIVDEITEYSHRELYKYGYHGHYEINFVAAAPESKQIAASENADITELLQTWENVKRSGPSRLSRFLDWITR